LNLIEVILAQGSKFEVQRLRSVGGFLDAPTCHLLKAQDGNQDL